MNTELLLVLDDAALAVPVGVYPHGEIVGARCAASVAAVELRAISAEMRARKVNHGKSTSPTLIAWADRIDAELARLGL